MHYALQVWTKNEKNSLAGPWGHDSMAISPWESRGTTPYFSRRTLIITSRLLQQSDQ